MKIFMWAASMSDGTWWYRLHLVAEALKARGHEVHIDTHIGAWALGKRHADIIVGQRVCNPRSAAMWREMANTPDRPWKLVYEIDDNLLQIDPRTNDLAAVGAHRNDVVNTARAIGAQAAEDTETGRTPHLRAMQSVGLSRAVSLDAPSLTRTDPGKRIPFQDFRSPGVQRAMRESINLADMVSVTVPPLAEALRPYNPHAAILPNSIPATLLDMKPQREPLAGRVVLGWQGSQTHTDDWRVAADAVRDVLWEREYETHMRFVGTAHPVGMRRNQVSFLEWTGDLWEHYRRVSRFHIGLAPLQGTVFNLSKSPLRAVEMMALGVPAVYSKVPAYEAVVEHGKTGFLARTPADWREYLNRLIASPELRARMGDAAREAARAWTIEERSALWERAYAGLLDKGDVIHE